MKVIGECIGVPELSFYWARHSFGNLARNKCRKSKDDVALALNHVDQGRRTTDIYLEKDWTIVDEVQDAVIALLIPTDDGIGSDMAAQYISTEQDDQSAKNPTHNPDVQRKTMRLISA